MSGMDPATAGMIRNLARKIDNLERRVRDQARASQASMRSLEEGDAQELYDEEGELRGVVGQLEDGGYGVEVFGGSELPPPSTPLVAQFPGGATITWDGFDAHDEAGWGPSFARVTIHLSTLPGEPADLETHVGSFESPDGGSLSFAQPSDVTTYCTFVAWTAAGVPSPASVEVEVTGGVVPEAPDVPTEVPSESPAVRARGLLTSILLSADAVAPTTEITFQISEDYDPANPGVATWADLPHMPTRDRLYQVLTLADGTTPLAEGTVYWFRSLASNVVGPAVAPSDPASATLDLEAVEVVADEVFTGRLNTPLTVTNRLEVGAGYWDPEWLELPGADGAVTRLSADGLNPHEFDGHIIGRSATFEDNTNLYGLTQLFGRGRMADGIPNPQVAPGVARTWDATQMQATEDSILGWPDVYGITQNATVADEWVIAHNFFGATLRSYDKVTGELNPFVFPGWSLFWPVGITTIGTNYYILGRDSNRTDRWFVYILDSDYNKTGEWEYTGEANSVQDPTISHDGTGRIVIARCRPPTVTDGGKPVVRTFTAANGTPSSGGAIGAEWVILDQVLDAHLNALYVGAADFGATRIVVGVRNGTTPVHAFNASGVSQNSHDWNRAAGQPLKGIVRDADGFHSLDNSGRVWHYTGKVTSQSTDSAYTWANADGSPETEESPVFTFTWPARAQLVVTGALPPEVGGVGSDVANAMRIYVGPAGGTLRLQGATLAVGTTSLTLETLDIGSATPPATNGFDAIAGEKGGWESTRLAALDGDPLTDFDGSGFARFLKLIQSGVVSTGTFSGANADKSVTITFPEPFDAAPNVFVIPTAASSVNIRNVPVLDTVSATGAVVVCSRAVGTGAYDLRWVAVAATV